jgi:DNA-binding NtrC family response regulator
MNGTVLVAHPDSSVRHSLGFALALGGYLIVFSASPHETQRLATCGEIDLVIADLDMCLVGWHDLFEHNQIGLTWSVPIMLLSSSTVPVTIPFAEGGDTLASEGAIRKLLRAIERAMSTQDELAESWIQVVAF